MSTDPSRDVVLVARAAAETIRTLGHQLTGDRLDLAEAYDILAELAVLAARYPHLLSRLHASLTNAADAGDLVAVDDTGRRHDPTGTLAAVGAHLAAASDAARTLTRALDTAHDHTASLARRGS